MSMVLKKHLREWFRVVELATVQVLGYVEDKKTFSMVAFSKSWLRNHLSKHLPVCVSAYN